MLFCGQCSKGIKKTRNRIFCFHYWLYLNFINTYKPPLLSSPVTDLISHQTNQHPRDMLCSYIRQNKQFYFLGLTLPKNGFLGFEIQKTNFGIRICISKYHVCQFSGKTDNFDFSDPNLPEKEFWVGNSENKFWNKN